ncbi:MAG: GatB/YqeY domain-containing protein [Bacteroidetes bacterium]|nr:GatB/YqeY domain-containing protein [Bacteroidota bacterium]MBU1580128.1 GatB/YqeY domain-containing protein [Bacteroidota bacterium]MBU2466188.1 GatB/YqeY domain-containing protein [Bacteroidota bacterium]MBU2557667.1 GatB/YqeY domain-containing protein [Bacteroidota bacterium]
MALEILINDDIKQAMRTKDTRKLAALRAIKAALLLEKTGKDVSSGEIPEAVEMKLLQKLVKQRKESSAVYTEQNRPELAEEEDYQASIIESYLPQQLSEEEIKAILSAIIQETGASSIKDMGKVMGKATSQIAGRADNQQLARIVKTLLGV